jgi:hypothetical protein
MKNSGGDAINESFLDCFSNWGCKFLILSLGGETLPNLLITILMEWREQGRIRANCFHSKNTNLGEFSTVKTPSWTSIQRVVKNCGHISPI